MQLSTFVRLGTVAFAGSGVVNIVADFVPLTGALNMAGVMLGILGLSAVFVHIHDRAGTLAYAGFVLATLGFTGIAGFLFAQTVIFPALAPDRVDALLAGPPGMAIFAAVIAYVAGVLAFAAGAWPTGRLPRWALALWGVATLPTMAAVALPPVVLTVTEIAVSIAILGLARHILSTPAQPG